MELGRGDVGRGVTSRRRTDGPVLVDVFVLPLCGVGGCHLGISKERGGDSCLGTEMAPFSSIFSCVASVWGGGMQLVRAAAQMVGGGVSGQCHVGTWSVPCRCRVCTRVWSCVLISEF